MFKFLENRIKMLKEYDDIIKLIFNASSLENFLIIKDRINTFKTNWNNQYCTEKLFRQYNYQLYEFKKTKKKR